MHWSGKVSYCIFISYGTLCVHILSKWYQFSGNIKQIIRGLLRNAFVLHYTVVWYNLMPSWNISEWWGYRNGFVTIWDDINPKGSDFEFQLYRIYLKNTKIHEETNDARQACDWIGDGTLKPWFSIFSVEEWHCVEIFLWWQLSSQHVMFCIDCVSIASSFFVCHCELKKKNRNCESIFNNEWISFTM